MKWLWLTIPTLLLFVVVKFALLGQQSQQQQPNVGLLDAQLRPCPASPNCACSEAHTDEAHAIAPLSGSDWQRFVDTVTRLGGHIITSDDHYLHATFTSTLFRFVDDLEARRDDAQGVIHIRSASRVGHSDFGANRKRIERIRRQMAARS